jgi:glycerol-3-phosphate O-acyltransferase
MSTRHTLIRPFTEAENRLAGFNRERGLVLAEVERRVVAARTAAATLGGDSSLEYVLNEVAYQEIQRLEKEANAGERRRLGDWRELARRLGGMDEREKYERLVGLVREYATDICGSFDPRVYRFTTGLLPTLITGLLAPRRLREGLGALQEVAGRVLVDGPIDHIRACADRGTLVVVPTHSSNMDSVVIGWALFRAGLPPCTYGAGKNLFTNPFISFFMRNLGAYRVDRRLKNAVYKDVLKTYAQILLERGYHALFFPGGTRGRSGAIESHLKLGLLGSAHGAYQSHVRAGHPERRIYVVPATIAYAIVLEAETLIDDYLAEQGKDRYIIDDDEFHSLRRIVAFARRVLDFQGAVHIRFGAPLDLFGNAVDDCGESIDARGRKVDPAQYLAGVAGDVVADPQRDAEYTRGLGEAIVAGFQRLAVLMPTNLAARAVFDRVAARHRTRDVYRLLRVCEGTEVPMAVLAEDIARWQAALAAHPEAGEISGRYRTGRPEDLITDAITLFRGYHSRPVLELEGDRVVVRDMRLLYYYQNRTAHIDPRAVGGPVIRGGAS